MDQIETCHWCGKQYKEGYQKQHERAKNCIKLKKECIRKNNEILYEEFMSEQAEEEQERLRQQYEENIEEIIS